MSSKQGAVIIVGSLNMDFVVQVRTLPKSGETVAGHAFSLIPGGKGANQAIAAGRLRRIPPNQEVWMIGCVGEDVYGEQLIVNLRSSDIETNHVQTTIKASTGVAFITVEASGQNQIVVAPGANYCLSPDEVVSALAEI